METPPKDVGQRGLLPEEEQAGIDDPVAQTTLILEESEDRSEDRLQSAGTVEHRRSDGTDR